jgi:hypothetical protein
LPSLAILRKGSPPNSTIVVVMRHLYAKTLAKLYYLVVVLLLAPA